MKRDKELSRKLRARMANVIADSGEVSKDEALRLATEAEQKMRDEVRIHTDALKEALIKHQVSALRAMSADFDKPGYVHVFERIAGNILQAFDKYKDAKDARVIESTYPPLEKEVIANFLAAVPRATGQASALANDRMDQLLHRILEEAGIEISYKDRAGLVTALRDLFRLYAGLSKVGLSDFAEIKYEEGEQNILLNLQALLSRSRNTVTEGRLQEHLSEPLRAAELGLSDYQLRTLTDQILWLFRDFVQAPDDKKDEVYQLGEDRIVFSTFDPHYLRTSIPKSAAPG